MYKEIKEDWKKASKTEKIVTILTLPITLPLGFAIAIAYTGIKVLWNKYGIAFLCALVLTSYYSDDTAFEVIWQEAQVWAFLIGIVLLIRRAYKELKKEGKI